MRIRYLEAALKQDVSFFDTNVRTSDVLEAALKQDVSFFDTNVRTSDVIYAINADTVVVQDAISEKLGNLIHYMATFVSGFIVGFTTDWVIHVTACRKRNTHGVILLYVELVVSLGTCGPTNCAPDMRKIKKHQKWMRLL